MNEFVYVEFIFDLPDAQLGAVELKKLGTDFILLETNANSDFVHYSRQRYCGKINSITATLIKLSNPLLANNMHVSYISDELKNKYRNR